jgi:hypothetical protein
VVNPPLNRRHLLAACAAPALLPPAAWPQHAHHGTVADTRKTRPSLACSAAFAPSGELWLAALDEQGRLQLQASADGGRRFGAPRLLPAGEGRIAADGENRPKLAFGPGGVVVVAWTEPLARPYTGRIRMLRSADGGRSFGAPFTVHRDTQDITHRFESIAFDARGTLHTVWVDKRDAEAARAAGRRDYAGAAIYRNESRDGGLSFGPDLKLADHSCECCRIALAPTPEGGLAALWRHVWPGSQRDHAFAVLGAEAPPRRASLDQWAIEACPHHGPGLAPAAGGGWHAVWFGERQGVPAVRYGRLAADGTPLGEARELPDESAEHADVLALGRRVAVVWRAFDGQAMRLRAWLSDDGGRRFTLRELARSAAENDHPRLARHGERAVAVWRTAEKMHVETLFA